MIRTAIVINLLVALLTISCQQTQQSQNRINDTVVYSLQQTKNVFELSDCKLIGITSLQKLIFTGLITNTSQDVISPIAGSWEINVAEGSRSLPIDIKMDTGPLAPKDEREFYLVYEPIGSRKLYQSTGLRGDLEQKYTMTIHWTDDKGEESEAIQFNAEETDFKNELNAFGLTSNATTFVVAETIPVKTSASLKTSFLSPTSSLQQNGNEILEKGFWTKFTTIHRQDSIFLFLRMVNQTGEAVYVSLDHLIFLDRENSLHPARVENDSVEIRNGGRTEIQLHYKLSVPGSLRLQLDGIKSTNGERMYSADVLLKPVDIGSI